MFHQVMTVVKSLRKVYTMSHTYYYLQCGEVFSQILKKLEKIMTTKAGIALAGQIQNRSSQNIIPFVKVALDQRSSKLNIIWIVKNS